METFYVTYNNGGNSSANGQKFLVREDLDFPHHFLISDGESHVGGGKLLKKYCKKDSIINEINFQIGLSIEGNPLTREQLKRITQNIVNAIVNEAEHNGITPDDADECMATFIVVRQVESDQTLRASISDY